MDKTVGEFWKPDLVFRPPETPVDPMEFLSRTWSASALEVSRAVASPKMRVADVRKRDDITLVPEDDVTEARGENNCVVSGNQFSFVSSETSQMVMDRIMSQSPEITSPRTSGRLSHSCGSFSDSPPVSPSDIDDFKFYRVTPSTNTHLRHSPSAAAVCVGGSGGGGSKTVGRWLKDRKEKKREEARTHNAQLHAAVSVAGVAAAVAALAAATAAQSSSGKDEEVGRTKLAIASAATLVAAQCVEAAEAVGADREQLASVVGSAVNVSSAGDIMTLTAAAATALRGAATLKARALKEVWNIAAVIPVEKGIPMGSTYGSEFGPEDSFLGICGIELLAKGCELLKRTRKGDFHWKIVSAYVNRTNQVTLKMKSKHVAGTITKKKKNVVVDVEGNIPAWPGRGMLKGGDDVKYFGIKTVERGVIEFECRTQREYDLWTQGVSRLLSLASDRRNTLVAPILDHDQFSIIPIQISLQKSHNDSTDKSPHRFPTVTVLAQTIRGLPPNPPRLVIKHVQMAIALSHQMPSRSTTFSEKLTVVHPGRRAGRKQWIPRDFTESRPDYQNR
ncbi:PREDICTED: VAN3-binding protein-like isoform X2 [Tarenaya hassleriana]|uniref:VAN3-binding protein-like isoform X2 n=1 Tax=Tarenaya hassleriana TaxID=28532 RepID=UPI00053C77AF|nr:PREDICTED: VAN3-binding protein-like isoform X2 [Tarenaya hassleriana]